MAFRSLAKLAGISPLNGLASGGGMHNVSPVAQCWRLLASAASAKVQLKDLPPGKAMFDAPRYTSEMPTTAYIIEAVKHMSVPDSIVRAILHPDRECSVTLPITMDKGEIELFVAHLVQHNNARGPFKGGIIFHPDVTLEGLRTLSAINTWKCALLDIPFGGAKLGINVDPRLLSEREQEKLTRKMVSAFQAILGPTTCIPAPDVGTDERHMSWVFDQYSRIKGFSPGVVSGKPAWLHGCPGRDRAPGLGAAVATREFLRKQMKSRVAGTRFLIQGFGKMGGAAAEMLQEQGGIIVGVSSSETAVTNEGGLDVKALRAHVAQGKYLAEFPGGTAVPNDESFLEIPCDVVIPAAVANTINANTAPRLNCKAVVEAANAGIDAEGNRILAERGIHVCPDILVAGGGVSASFMEWTQNMTNLQWDAEDLRTKVDATITAASSAMFQCSRDLNVPLRTAAYIVALDRIARADVHRGHG